MCWGCGSLHAVLIVECDDATEIIGGIWCWLCGRAVHQNCLGLANPATLGCRYEDSPLFPPGRLG